MQEVLIFCIPRQSSDIISFMKDYKGMRQRGFYLGLWKQACVLRENRTFALPPCDVTASIWDPYFVQPWPKTPSRTNYFGNAEATTCQLRACRWALSWTICERWKSRGSSPVICIFITDAWGHKCVHISEQRKAHMHFWAKSRLGDVISSHRWANEANRRQRNEPAIGCWESCSTDTRQWSYSEQDTGDISPSSTLSSLSPWCKSNSGTTRHYSTPSAFSSDNHKLNTFFCCLFIHCWPYLNVK